MWIARFLLFLLAQAIASGLFEGVQEFLLTRTTVRQHGFFLWAKESAAAGADAGALSSSGSGSSGSGSGSGHGLARFFFGQAVVHSFNEQSFVETVVKGAGAGTGSRAPWLIHLYSPFDEAAGALNKLLEDEVAPILALQSAVAEEEGTAPAGVKLHIGKIDVTAHPHLAASLGWLDDDEEDESEEGDEGQGGGSTNLGPHRSILKIVRTPAPASSSPPADHHQQHHQQPLQLASSTSPQQQQQQPPAAAIAALSRRLVAEEYTGRRTRQALLELAEHATTPASFFSSLYALPTPVPLRTPAELAAFRAEHPFVFLLAEPEAEQAQQELGEVLRLAFVSTCEARMWRHCALVGRAALPEALASSAAPGPVVAKLERGDGFADAETFSLDAAAFARRPEALREWLQAQNYPLVSPMPLALEGPAFERLLRAGGRLVVARVRGGGEHEDDKAVMERLHAVGRDSAHRAWLRAGRVRLGYAVEGGPRTQLPLGAAGEGTGASLARLFVVDGPTRGVYNVEDPAALLDVLRGLTEGRVAVPTFPLVWKDDPLGAYPHVAKLLAQVHTLAVAVAAAVALGLVLGLVVLLSPRRWWIPRAGEKQQQEAGVKQEPPQHRSPQRLVAKFGSGDISASVTGAGALMESEM